MSMLHRLWLAILISTGIGFLGSLALSLWTARAYLEQQLYAQSMDSAHSLALSMSQQADDPASFELLLSALFDNGHYRQVRFLPVAGGAPIARVQEAGGRPAPAWFKRVLPLAVVPAAAQVSDGWRQIGTVDVEASTDFAYASLWRGAGGLLAFCAMIGILAGWLGSLVVRQIRAPLAGVVAQAKAISDSHFIVVAEPTIPELRQVTSAMNSMVLRLQSLFAEEASRIEQLRRDASSDPLTALANRRYFLGRLHAELHEADAGEGGVLLLLRLSDLRAINEALGQAATDALLCATGERLCAAATGQAEALAGRLAGGEFALLLPNMLPATAQALAGELAASLTVVLRQAGLDFQHAFALAALPYQHDEDQAALLRRAEAALAQATAGAPLVLAAVGAPASAARDWRATLEWALSHEGFLLQAFPVQDMNGRALHEELVLRLAQPGSEPLTAASFLPEAARLGLLGAIDREVLRLGLAWIKQRPGPVALNLSGEFVRDSALREQLCATLFRAPLEARHLWLEVNEGGIGTWGQAEVRAFAGFAHSLRPLGLKIGIDHFGRRFDRLPQLHDLGLDYLKIDASFIHDIDTESEHLALLKAIQSVTRSLGMQVLATGVTRRGEWEALAALGLDGLTGPVTRTVAEA